MSQGEPLHPEKTDRTRIVTIARVAFYFLALLAAGFAISAGFVERNWREPLLQLGWYFLAASCVALLVLLVFVRLVRDRPEAASTLFVDSRP
jgi:hypothetical protein